MIGDYIYIHRKKDSVQSLRRSTDNYGKAREAVLVERDEVVSLRQGFAMHPLRVVNLRPLANATCSRTCGRAGDDGMGTVPEAASEAASPCVQQHGT